MSKRRFNPSAEEDRTPVVEKLYKANQPSFHCAGGFLDDDDEAEERREQIAEAKQKRLDLVASGSSMPDDCSTCNKALFDSWLWDRFNHPVCDSCRDDLGEHKLVPRTEVKNEYMLKDGDLDIRKPPLRFYSKKNPHNPRYGDMKLYLKCQVIERMLQVHGSWDNLDDAKKKRTETKEIRSERNFEKKVKEMRQHLKGARGVRLKTDKAHEHRYGHEEYDEKNDVYRKGCVECDYVMTYEKM